MTYAVIDLEARHADARARRPHAAHRSVVRERRDAHVITPDGMVLGLRLPGAGERFEELLEEHTQPLAPGDVDRALHRRHHRGDGRRRRAVRRRPRWRAWSRASTTSTPRAFASASLREVQAFVGDAEPHDDMTMIVLKIDDGGVRAGARAWTQRCGAARRQTPDPPCADRVSSGRTRRSRPRSSAACSTRTGSSRCVVVRRCRRRCFRCGSATRQFRVSVPAGDAGDGARELIAEPPRRGRGRRGRAGSARRSGRSKERIGYSSATSACSSTR